MSKIDWKNHFIAFLSALLGILIAFQLDNYRENKEEQDKLNRAYELVISELENNISIYRDNVNTIGSWLVYYDLIKSLKEDQTDSVIAKDQTLNKATQNGRRASRLDAYTIISINDSTVIIKRKDLPSVGTGDLTIDIFPRTGLSTSAWNAGINSGIFANLPPETLALLSHIYEWINKDLGKNENAFFEYGININRQYDNVTQIVYNYQVMYQVQKMKLTQLNPIYKKLIETSKD